MIAKFFFREEFNRLIIYLTNKQKINRTGILNIEKYTIQRIVFWTVTTIIISLAILYSYGWTIAILTTIVISIGATFDVRSLIRHYTKIAFLLAIGTQTEPVALCIRKARTDAYVFHGWDIEYKYLALGKEYHCKFRRVPKHFLKHDDINKDRIYILFNQECPNESIPALPEFKRRFSISTFDEEGVGTRSGTLR